MQPSMIDIEPKRIRVDDIPWIMDKYLAGPLGVQVENASGWNASRNGSGNNRASGSSADERKDFTRKLAGCILSLTKATAGMMPRMPPLSIDSR